mmetsp:Transcript_64605/g.140634  ORF Transcript_64605/g.140634 Transcript_64605/m.140634 type:complete len:633 (-) Transcript_64605:177-2075(-)
MFRAASLLFAAASTVDGLRLPKPSKGSVIFLDEVTHSARQPGGLDSEVASPALAMAAAINQVLARGEGGAVTGASQPYWPFQIPNTEGDKATVESPVPSGDSIDQEEVISSSSAVPAETAAQAVGNPADALLDFETSEAPAVVAAPATAVGLPETASAVPEPEPAPAAYVAAGPPAPNAPAPIVDVAVAAALPDGIPKLAEALTPPSGIEGHSAAEGQAAAAGEARVPPTPAVPPIDAPAAAALASSLGSEGQSVAASEAMALPTPAESPIGAPVEAALASPSGMEGQSVAAGQASALPTPGEPSPGMPAAAAVTLPSGNELPSMVSNAQSSPEMPPAALPSEFLVRYAVLAPSQSLQYVEDSGLPMLRSSLCLAEQNLAPLLYRETRTLPSYVVYTDNYTHPFVVNLLRDELPSLNVSRRVRLMNLDMDEEEWRRMAPFQGLGLGDRDLAAVRRTLADSALLPDSAGRLLLGTDVSLLSPARELLKNIALLKRGQALYMVDDRMPGAASYTLPGFNGPQCAGLLGDFVYLAPGLNITVQNLASKLWWYSQQPINASRTEPPCSQCLEMALSAGRFAMDQFGLMLALGEATGGPANCLPLNTLHYRSGPSISERSLLEGSHDKIVSSCKAQR